MVKFIRMHQLYILIYLLTQSLFVTCLPPYFFLCNYQGSLEPLPQESDRLLLSVTLDGNPRVYNPGEIYTVRISSSENFNGLLVTGLFSSSRVKENIHPLSYGMTSIGFGQDNPVQSDFICGLLHSEIFPDKTPASDAEFLWTAPAKGTGCISFMATASVGMQIVFQDVVAYQICETGQVEVNSRPSLADVHSDGVILRDDFDSKESINIWSLETVGVSFNHDCGEITHENAAVFCGEFPTRQLVTPPLNLSSASFVQFTSGTGSCSFVNVTMSLSYRPKREWVTFKQIRVTQQSKVSVINLPDEAKAESVSLKFSQDSIGLSNSGCWAMDNVLIAETENRPAFLYEDMDPIDASKWLFMPGAGIEGKCQSHVNALVFSSSANETRPSYAVTRDLDLSGGSVQGAPPVDVEVTGGKFQPMACGHSNNTSVFTFNERGRREFCTTPADSLRNIAAVRFILSMGSGDCHFDSSSAKIALVGLSESNEEAIAFFDRDAYKRPRQVTIPLQYHVQHSANVLCFVQMSDYDRDENVWTIDSLELIPAPAQVHHFMQFAICTECSPPAPNTRISLEYSNDFGRSWHSLQEPCFPETCDGVHWPYKSMYAAGGAHGWTRVNIRLPAAALTDHSRFRWIENGSKDQDTRWAIDDIYIGTDEMCPEMCNGHGVCFPDGCRCDVGWQGFFCNISSQNLPSSLAVDFNQGQEIDSAVSMALGAHAGYECGMLGTGKSLVFNDAGARMLLTKPHNGLQIKFLQFAILMGRYSTVGTCQAPSSPGDGVLVHFTINNGVTWYLLTVIPFNSERRVIVVSVPLPSNAQVPGLQIRWLQPNENAHGKAVWAIDDIILSSELYKSIYSTPENFQRIYTASVSFHTGILTNFCNKTNVLLFSPLSVPYIDTLRYAETQTMETSDGYVLEADLNLQCQEEGSAGAVPKYDEYHELLLQYSKDEGVTWHLVQEENLPGSPDEESFHRASIYHASEYSEWTTAILPMPRNTWSSHLRLRVVHNENSQSVWALDNVYMGPACPMHCRNRGRCRNGVCQCNAGSVGPSCLSRTQLVTGVDESFSDIAPLKKKDWRVIGASVTTKKKGDCGAMPSDRYLHFNKPGVRKLVTPDIDTSLGGQIQFYIRISGLECKVPMERANGILLQYSNNGGITWTLLNELYYEAYTTPQYVHRTIPAGARTKQTRFRWWQPRNGGTDQEPWSIGDVIVGEPISLDGDVTGEEVLKIHGRRSAADFFNAAPKTFILLANDGQSSDFCDGRPDSYVFNGLNGDRFATTDDFTLETGDTIQFEINIDCSESFSWDLPVHLEFSHDEGYSWDLLVRSCYPDGRPKSQMPVGDPDENISVHDCTGAARELTESSVYHQGDYRQWRRVVIPVPRRVAAMPVRLRWWQHVPANSSASAPAAWAIGSVYIGPSCMSYCSGHGKCAMGLDAETCVCDEGYSGEHCQVATNPVAGFWDHISVRPNPAWWNNILGNSNDVGCGEVHEGGALYFGRDGSRKAETVSLDTVGIRMIQFYLKIGSSDDSDTCTLPEQRDEAVLLQYSNDNGISWDLIKELSFDAYSQHGERVIVDIPFPAKSPSTSFRWWQPLRENGEHRSQWSLDDVFIGGPDLLSDGFADDFNGFSLSETNWYRVRGGGVGKFTKCSGTDEDDRTALVFASPAGVAETWDFRLNSGSFVQFDIAMGCESETPAKDVISLDYSTDSGESWKPTIPSCSSDSSGCEQDFGSFFYAGLHQRWTRRTVLLPDRTMRSQIRFRWTKTYPDEGSSSWAIDNLYIGNGCPWMCTGHGKCWPSEEDNAVDVCICDEGFERLPHCQASQELNIGLMDTFDKPWNSEGKYLKMIGHDTNAESSIMINNENLIMTSLGIRMLETIPINTVDTKYVQFHLEFHGIGENASSVLLLQSSRNGGITWSTIDWLYPSDLKNTPTLVHSLLPEIARHDTVSFRLWQSSVGAAPPVFKAAEDVWTLDNFLIGGRVSGCDGHYIEDTFSSALESTTISWLHYTHLNTTAFCGSSDALLVGQNVGEHSITTRDVCVSENYVLQFKIAVGCSARPSNVHGVRLEYSTDHGVTWSLVRENCQGDQMLGRCSDELHPPTIYYSGTSDGWRRVFIPLNGHTCGSLRFRWYQGFYADEFEAARAVPWALDSVYIGPQCDQMCNGHGTCSNEGLTCTCDEGYGGDTCCDIELPNPAFFEETFYNEDGLGEQRAMDQWSTLSGGSFHKDTVDCDGREDLHQWSYRVGGSGERILDTRDLDLRDADSVQFYITFTREAEHANINGQGADGSASQMGIHEFVFVQYSTDGGILWNLLEVISILPFKVDELQYLALTLPEQSRTNATRMRWWQPNGNNKFGFKIDQIVVGGPSQALDEHFDKDTSYWVEVSGAKIQPSVGTKCCDATLSSDDAVCHILEVGGDAERRHCQSNFASTNGVKVARGSYISFNLGMNCRAPIDHCEGIELQYSVDFGKTWKILVPPCYPSDAKCTNFYQGSTFLSDIYPYDSENKRAIVPIPEQAWSPSTRFRWLQTSSSPEAWYLDNVYIGGECPGACLGHGECHHGECICDKGWAGFICQTATENPPAELKEVFTASIMNSSMFSRVVGGEVDNVCGEVGFGRALHFFEPCSRLLETTALNTTKADFVQFMFRADCGLSPPSERDQGVLVDYTVNGGAVWHNLAELYFDNHNEKPSFVNVLLPENAKATGTKFRWWQPQHSGLNQTDWALDNLLIGGKREEAILSDDFNVAEEVGPAGLQLDRGDNEMWQFYDNTGPDSFCGRDNILLAGKVPGLDVTVSTKDFFPKEGFMMQYTIVVHCQDVQKSHQPVHVQYSTDYGDTWQYVVPQCVPSDRDCFGKEITQPSAHFISPDWRRKTIWIPSFLYGQPVRFRFFQEESDVKWALDRVFIGPACPDACSGHGDCFGVPQEDIFRIREVNYDVIMCFCDLGYVGPNCDLDFDRNQKYLKDDFNAGEHIGSWLIIEPRNTDVRCAVVVDGHSMAFSGVGPRQAETEDLDLRDARFAQHNAVIGGVADDCLPSKQRDDGLLMQYSVDGGITWNMLHELDYESYRNSTHDYISLPLNARTKATRLRWWQPVEIDDVTGRAGMGEDRAGWALDNIYIGGQEVNVYSLEDNFEAGVGETGDPGSLNEELYEFYPNGGVGRNQCPGDATVHMMWPGTSDLYPKQSLTTRQIIVTPGHMIQFKIKVGCTVETTCSPLFLVKLEYREDPRYDDSWRLVEPACYPGSPPSHLCHPYTYHAPSAYKLEYQNVWTRITIPLYYISSDTTQFRWLQDDNAPELYSWAIDELYIGESCPNYCSGHGKCTKSLECMCDKGYTGEDCSQPLPRYVLPDFRETFESESINERLWSNLSGGKITSTGCGPLRPYGFSRSVYFYDCGRRQLVTREMDLRKALQIQFVLQFGSMQRNEDCQIYQGGRHDVTVESTIVFQFTSNGGITWHTLREFRPYQYLAPFRVTQMLPTTAKTKATMLRWWQPTHHGKGFDQWALDNVDIIRTRKQRYFHFLDYQAQQRAHLQSHFDNAKPPVWNPRSSSETLKNKPAKVPSFVSVKERMPPDDDLVRP